MTLATSCARLAENSSSSALSVSSRFFLSSRMERIRSDIGVPPGSRKKQTALSRGEGVHEHPGLRGFAAEINAFECQKHAIT